MAGEIRSRISTIPTVCASAKYTRRFSGKSFAFAPVQKQETDMFTRREALFGVTMAAAAVAAMPPFPALARASAPGALPRENVTLVAPPFVHAHDQIAKGGPKIVEFSMAIEEKPVVIDAD